MNLTRPSPYVDIDSCFSIGQLLSEATANQAPLPPETLLVAMAVFYDGDTITEAARSLDVNYFVAQRRID